MRRLVKRKKRNWMPVTMSLCFIGNPSLSQGYDIFYCFYIVLWCCLFYQTLVTLLRMTCWWKRKYCRSLFVVFVLPNEGGEYPKLFNFPSFTADFVTCYSTQCSGVTRKANNGSVLPTRSRKSWQCDSKPEHTQPGSWNWIEIKPSSHSHGATCRQRLLWKGPVKLRWLGLLKGEIHRSYIKVRLRIFSMSAYVEGGGGGPV